MDNINRIKKYLVEVENSSPLRIGNGDEEGIGILIQDNFAVINGTTFAGIFKEFLLHKDDEKIFNMVFPNQNREKNISKVYFYDSLSEGEITEKDVICRTHIKINKNLGVSEDEHLFNEYHISEGKRFYFRFDVMGLQMEEKDYLNICKLVEEFIYRITNGDIAIGSKSTFGFGRFQLIEKASYYSREYDLSKEVDLDKYLNTNIVEKKDLSKYKIESNTILGYEIIFRGYCEDGFIINDDYETKIVDGDRESKVNVTHKERINGDSYYVIPSSTIKGIVREYSSKIYETLGKNSDDLHKIFGASNNDIGKNKKGKVTFNDCKIKIKNKESEKRYSRIKIDRFTGGNINLFHNEVIIIPKEKSIEFKVNLKDYDEKVIALILLTFRDIGLGCVTIGSGNNVGYGRFTGESIKISEPDKKEFIVKFKDEVDFEGDIDEFNKIIGKLDEGDV